MRPILTYVTITSVSGQRISTTLSAAQRISAPGTVRVPVESSAVQRMSTAKIVMVSE